MSYEFPPDVDKLIRDHLAAGGYSSVDDVLREALISLGAYAHSASETDEEYRQAVAAVREGLADAEVGRMWPVRELMTRAQGERPIPEAE